MTQRLPRLILFAALALQGASPVHAAPPKHPPAPPVRPVFPDDPPPESDSVAQQYAPQQAAQYAPNPTVSEGPFGALFAPSQQAFAQPAPTAFAQPQPQEARSMPAQPAPPQPQPMQTASVQTASLRTPPLDAGPADYAQGTGGAPVDLRRDRGDEVAGFSIAEKAGLAEMTRKYARQHGIPLALLHRIIMRESKYCPRLVNRRYFGLMQITPATARSMGYHGAPKGLLDPETNLAYAAPYLANAWALADGDMDRAVRLYASGYYYTAKSKNMLSQMRDASSPPVRPPVQSIAAAPPPPRQPGNIFEAMFSSPNQ
jgi:soluble lytic murein transglycosylase-like protein